MNTCEYIHTKDKTLKCASLRGRSMSKLFSSSLFIFQNIYSELSGSGEMLLIPQKNNTELMLQDELVASPSCMNHSLIQTFQHLTFLAWLLPSTLWRHPSLSTKKEIIGTVTIHIYIYILYILYIYII